MITDTSFDVVAIPELIAELERTDDARRLEIVADILGAARNVRATLPLLTRLCDPVVQDNDAAADAVCAALVGLGVMRVTASGCFALRLRHELDRPVVAMLSDLGARVPMRYYLART